MLLIRIHVCAYIQRALMVPEVPIMLIIPEIVIVSEVVIMLIA